LITLSGGLTMVLSLGSGPAW